MAESRRTHRMACIAGVIVLLSVSGCSSSQSKISATVTGWQPEGANHVAATVRYTNHGSSPATAYCTVAALDSGGSDVGDDTDGPANKIPPGGATNIRMLIKTSINSHLVSSVKAVGGGSCATV